MREDKLPKDCLVEQVVEHAAIQNIKAFDINLRCPVTLKVISERYLGEDINIDYINGRVERSPVDNPFSSDGIVPP